MLKKESFTFLGEYGFNNEKYLEAQSAAIVKRASYFDKLYLEFGGKLLFDYHAARVLPGYRLNTKIEVVKKLAEKREVEFLPCVSARDLQSGRKMGALGISYRDFTLKLMDAIEDYGFKINSVCINLYSGESAAKDFGAFLKKNGYSIYYRGLIKDYPHNLKSIASSSGFGKKPFIKTKAPIVIVTGAGPNSGKLATCLTLVYQDHLQGKQSGYAKLESFPIWNLPLKSPINYAYEAATADIGDYNLIDKFHKKAYGMDAVNYNRDVESFPIIQKMLGSLVSKNNFVRNYKSPTDMGVNMMTEGITDLKLCERAAEQEIVRRYFAYNEEAQEGNGATKALKLVEKLLKKCNLKPEDRKVVEPAREAAQRAQGYRKLHVGSAIQLNNGIIITGKNSHLMHAESAVILNALKKLASVSVQHDVLVPDEIEQIRKLRKKMYGDENENLTISEVLVVLALSARESKEAAACFDRIEELRSCEMHTTHMLSRDDSAALRALGINYTSDGKMEVGKLYMG